MRLTLVSQLTKGLRSTVCSATAKDVDKQLGRRKWSLWHGNVFRVLQSKLRRPLPQWRTHLNRICRIHDHLGGKQALRQASIHAVDGCAGHTSSLQMRTSALNNELRSMRSMLSEGLRQVAQLPVYPMLI